MAEAAIDFEQYLADKCAEYFDKPYDFVVWAFPWGEAETELEGEDGPDAWQTKILKAIQEGLQTGAVLWDGELRDVSTGIYISVRSGHGIGKSALMAWLDIWFLSTHPTPRIVTTANTQEQLTNKTWAEQAKWHNLAINKHWFVLTATKFFLKNREKAWFSSAVPWSEHRHEAFAGTHSRHVLYKFDEASAIADKICEVAQGAFTESAPGAHRIFLMFGNPTKATGYFSSTFKKFRHRWLNLEVDARTAKKADKRKFEEWIQDYGLDHDFVRVRVLGKEPRAGDMQMIATGLVDDAYGRAIPKAAYYNLPKIMGVDVARYGDDRSTWIFRQGLASYALRKWRPPAFDNKWLMTFASLVAQAIDRETPDAVFIDGAGVGGGVIDRLRQLGYTVIEVQPGEKAQEADVYVNARTEMWYRLREWLAAGGCIPEDREIYDDLIGPEYGFDARERMQMERKKDMKERGLASPDCGDCLAYTFYAPVARIKRSDRQHLARCKTEYDDLA